MVMRSTCPQCRAVFRRSRIVCPVDGTPLQPLPQDPLVGKTLNRRYRIEAVLYDSGIARTYKGRDQKTRERLLVRVMLGDYARAPGARAIFERQLAIGQTITHPNILRVREAGETHIGVPYLLCDYLEGRPLPSLIDTDAPLPLSRALPLFADVTRALAHLHESGHPHGGLGAEAIVVVDVSGRETAVLAEAAGGDPGGGESSSIPTYWRGQQARGGEGDLPAMGLLLGELLGSRSRGTHPGWELSHTLRLEPHVEALLTRLLTRDGSRFESMSALLAHLHQPIFAMESWA